MVHKKHPWEDIFARDGRVFTKLLPAFHTAAQNFTVHQTRRILDLGCGNGRHVIGFEKLEFNVVGFDISSTGLKLTQEWLREERLPAQLIQGDTRFNFPFQSASFDGLISTQVIHHAQLAEIRHTISEIWRVMANEGIALISVAGKIHHNWSYQEIEPGTYLPLDGPEARLPHHIFTIEELVHEFRNFQIQEVSPRDEGRVLLIWLMKKDVLER